MTGSDPSKPVVIRPMTEADLEQVQAIDQASFPVPWPAASFRFELRENPAAVCRVAEASLPEGNRVVGMVVVWLIMDEAHVATIAIHPDFRSRGIGRTLLKETLRECIRIGAKEATLEVREGNLVAQSMYRDFGFEVVNRRKHYYADNGEDALLMFLPDMNEEYLEWLGDEDE